MCWTETSAWEAFSVYRGKQIDLCPSVISAGETTKQNASEMGLRCLKDSLLLQMQALLKCCGTPAWTSIQNQTSETSNYKIFSCHSKFFGGNRNPTLSFGESRISFLFNKVEISCMVNDSVCHALIKTITFYLATGLQSSLFTFEIFTWNHVSWLCFH